MPDLGNSRSQFRTDTHVQLSTEGTNQQEVILLTNLRNNVEVYADMIDLTENTTIRVFKEVDGSTERLLSTRVFPTDYDTDVKAISIILNGGNHDMRVTFASAAAEGSDRDVPLEIIETTRL